MKSENTENKFLVGIYEKAINNKFTLEQKMFIAKSAGYDFIELSVDETAQKMSRLDWTDEQIHEVLVAASKNNIVINSMTLSAHRLFPFGSKDHKKREKAYSIMTKAFRLARKLGIRTIQLAGYDVYYEQGDLQTAKLFLEGLRFAVEQAEKNSVMLAIETMDTPFLGTVTKALRFVHLINSPFLNVYPDVGNLWQFATDIESELALDPSRIIAFHFKDTQPNKFRNIPFGEGDVDFVKFFEIYRKLKFNKPVMIEMWSDNNLQESVTNSIFDISSALEFLKSKWSSSANSK